MEDMAGCDGLLSRLKSEGHVGVSAPNSVLLSIF